MSDETQPPSPPSGSPGGGDGAGAGATPPQQHDLTPEQLFKAIAEDTHLKVEFLSQLFAPHALQLSGEEYQKLIIQLAREQLVIKDTVFTTLIDPEAIKANPWVGLKLTKMGPNGPAGPPFQIMGPKRMIQNQPQDRTFATILCIAMMLHPEYRALLRLYGIKYEFVQAHDPDNKPRIIIPGRR